MSSNVAAIDGVTGPGRRTVLIASNVKELSFKLEKKIIEVVNWDSSIGQYDLAEVNNIQVSSDGDNFTVAMTSKVENEDARRKEDARIGDTRTGDTAGRDSGGSVTVTKSVEVNKPTVGTSPANPSVGGTIKKP